MQLYSEMVKSCVYCDSHNVFSVDSMKGVVACLDCFKTISKEGNYCSIIYIAQNMDESRNVFKLFESVSGSASMQSIVGFNVVTVISSQFDIDDVSKILCQDIINLENVSITFNKIVYEPDHDIANRLREFGVVDVLHENGVVSCSVIGNSLDGIETLKLIGMLLLSGCSSVVFK